MNKFRHSISIAFAKASRHVIVVGLLVLFIFLVCTIENSVVMGIVLFSAGVVLPTTSD